MKTPLDNKIRAFEKRRAAEKGSAEDAHEVPTSRVGYEFLGATLVSAAVGYALDEYFATTPTLTLILFFIGFCAGVYNAWRSMNGLGDRVGFKKPSKKQL